MEPEYYDLLLIGGGAAGLSLALHLAPQLRVGLITKGPLPGATYYAQGGFPRYGTKPIPWNPTSRIPSMPVRVYATKPWCASPSNMPGRRFNGW